MKDILKIGVVGLGCRGIGLLGLIYKMKDVDVLMVCDVYDDRIKAAQAMAKKYKRNIPEGVKDYHELLNADLDAVMIFCSWKMHTEIAIAAMRAGKAVASEVGGAYSVKECFDLVEAYEETKTPFMMLENCCYGEYELACLRMAREGVFGTIVNAEGGYKHDLRKEICYGEKNRHYRLNEYINRNCDNYPTHEIGPISKILNINYGNRFLSLRSVASKSAGLKEYIGNSKDKSLEALKNVEFKQGDVVHTLIDCLNGETVRITLDTTLPRPYSRGFTVQGTKGYYTEEGNYCFFDKNRHTDMLHVKYNKGKKAVKKYAHPIWKWYRKAGVRGTHGGMDYLVLRAFFESLQQGCEIMPIDVYDAATWMAITALSEESIVKGGERVEFPDFTKGQWQCRQKAKLNKYYIS